MRKSGIILIVCFTLLAASFTHLVEIKPTDAKLFAFHAVGSMMKIYQNGKVVDIEELDRKYGLSDYRSSGKILCEYTDTVANNTSTFMEYNISDKTLDTLYVLKADDVSLAHAYYLDDTTILVKNKTNMFAVSRGKKYPVTVYPEGNLLPIFSEGGHKLSLVPIGSDEPVAVVEREKYIGDYISDVFIENDTVFFSVYQAEMDNKRDYRQNAYSIKTKGTVEFDKDFIRLPGNYVYKKGDIFDKSGTRVAKKMGHPPLIIQNNTLMYRKDKTELFFIVGEKTVTLHEPDLDWWGRARIYAFELQ